MKNYLNFKQTSVYKALEQIYSGPLPHLQSLRNKDKNYIETPRFIFDYSKTHFEPGARLFVQMLNELRFDEQKEALFRGLHVNTTEDRPALHTALRLPDSSDEFPSEEIKNSVIRMRNKIKDFVEKFRHGLLSGATGKPLDTVVNIGIGGSHLGPQTIVHALRNRNTAPYAFLSNVDDEHLADVLEQIDPETTLFIVVSKSFSTKETLYNAGEIQNYIKNKFGKDAIAKHFIAVTSAKDKAVNFGIDPARIFEMQAWTGGRFSLWSSAGISIPLILGYDLFEKLLHGAYLADRHFRDEDVLQNIPVIMALLTLIYNNLAGYESEAHIPYSEKLFYWPFYLQQLSMESNGKSVQRNGKTVDYQTGPVVWGATGTNAQHSFFQLLHQGTKIAPVYFTGYAKSETGFSRNRTFLLANLLAQAEGLADGKKSSDPHKNFEGNRPSVSFIFNELSAENLGFLIALFEHKTYVESILWNINAFDQPGVELGKEIALRYEQNFTDNKDSDNPLYRFIKRNM